MPLIRQRLYAIGALLLASIGASQACQICVPYPKQSAADHLLAAQTVVLARENPDKPFSYRATEVLKGTHQAEIDLFLDSSTRRMLAAYPQRSIALASLRDGDSPGWKRIGTADNVTGPVLREVLASGTTWQQYPRRRVEYFATFLGHKNPQLRALAHLEVGRAPYNQIRQLGDALSRDEIRSFLSNYRYAEWHPLYILLLAQNPEPEDRATILKSFQSAARFGTTDRLAAWATALIEIQGAEAIEEIERLFFNKTSRSQSEVEEVTRALSVHGTNGTPDRRDRIVSSYRAALAHYPDLTPQIAKDLIAWKRSELSGKIAEYAASRPRNLDFQTTLRLRAYARENQNEP